MRNTIIGLALFLSVLLPATASAYLMAEQTYSNMFERADVVVIATPVVTQDSEIELKLEVEQPKQVTDLIKTVDTEFKLAYTLKGTLNTNMFHFLHLSRKDEKPFSGAFGAVGTFFVDFDSKDTQPFGEFMRKGNRQNSFILFMKKRKDGTFYPAWRPMEGSRAIIPVRKNGEL